ncbi:MAG: DUF996 domain-containing protein [Candidatus Hadarchaeaceae archaeon]
MSLENHKNIGGVGALLIVLSPIAMGPTFGVLGIVGLILLLISLNGMARYFREKKIFENALYGVALAVVGAVIALVVLVLTVLQTQLQAGFNLFYPDLNRMGQMFLSPAANWILPFLGGIIAVLLVLFVCFLLAAIYFRRALKILAAKTEINMFETAGMLLLIGAVLTIVGIGLLLLWVSFMLLTIAFFSIKIK